MELAIAMRPSVRRDRYPSIFESPVGLMNRNAVIEAAAKASVGIAGEDGEGVI